MRLIPILLLITLSGCTSVRSTYQGYKSAVANELRATVDMRLETMKWEICSMPISTLIRNPEWYETIKSLCIVDTSVTIDEILYKAKENAK